MGGVASTACCCCPPAREKTKGSKTHRLSSSAETTHDGSEAWFDQHDVPLLSARHDEEIVSDGMVITKTVLMRSAPQSVETPQSSPRRGIRESPTLHKRGSHKNSSNSSDSSWELTSPRQVEDSDSYSTGRSARASSRATSTSPDRGHHRCTQRSESTASKDESAVADDDLESKPGSPRSTRSPSTSSTGSPSPKRKQRYGRKNYRANSARSKTT